MTLCTIAIIGLIEVVSFFSNNEATLIAGISALLGGGAAVWTAYNTMRSRHSNDTTMIVNNALGLIAALQAEIVRLNNENATQRADIDSLTKENGEKNDAIIHLFDRIDRLEKRGKTDGKQIS